MHLVDGSWFIKITHRGTTTIYRHCVIPFNKFSEILYTVCIYLHVDISQYRHYANFIK